MNNLEGRKISFISSFLHVSDKIYFYKCLNYKCSYEPDDIVFERHTPSSPKRFNDSQRDPFGSHEIKHHRGSADQTFYHASGMTPDSPISQVRRFPSKSI